MKKKNVWLKLIVILVFIFVELMMLDKISFTNIEIIGDKKATIRSLIEKP